MTIEPLSCKIKELEQNAPVLVPDAEVGSNGAGALFLGIAGENLFMKGCNRMSTKKVVHFVTDSFATYKGVPDCLTEALRRRYGAGFVFSVAAYDEYVLDPSEETPDVFVLALHEMSGGRFFPAATKLTKSRIRRLVFGDGRKSTTKTVPAEPMEFLCIVPTRRRDELAPQVSSCKGRFLSVDKSDLSDLNSIIRFFKRHVEAPKEVVQPTGEESQQPAQTPPVFKKADRRRAVTV